MQIRISDRIDGSPVSAFQLRVVFLCGLVALLDGLDVQTMALVIPSLAEAWNVDKPSFGPVLSSSFAGLMIGALMGGMLGDRFGRRGILITAFMGVGMASILTATATSHLELMVWRLLTGLAIGSCMPNFTVLTAEYVPGHRQAFFITLLYSAIPIGGIVGGLLAPPVIAAGGWRAVFLLSGAIPALIAVILFFSLPESPRFLATRGLSPQRSGDILARIDKGYHYAPDHRFAIDEKVKGSPFGALFKDGRLARTVLFWIILFCNLAGFYVLTSWLPTLLVREGWSVATASQSISIFFMGGVVGCVTVGWLIDRFGPYSVLAVMFLANAGSSVMLGGVANEHAPMMIVIALAGFALNAAQTGSIILGARIYPTAIRSTGVGWGLGVGRIGAVLSPSLGGLALASEWSRLSFFAAAAMPAIICALAVTVLGRIDRPGSEPGEG